MSEANGTAGNLAGRMQASRRIIGELGAGCTYAAYSERMEAAGFRPAAQPTFYVHRKEAFADGAVPAVIPDDRPPLGALERLVKFAAVVASVGGIAEARRMLDAVERVERELGKS